MFLKLCEIVGRILKIEKEFINVEFTLPTDEKYKTDYIKKEFTLKNPRVGKEFRVILAEDECGIPFIDLQWCLPTPP